MTGNYQRIISAMKNRTFVYNRNLDLEGGINALFRCCQDYWKYTCQYENLKPLQNHHLPNLLPEDTPDIEGKLSLWQTWILEVLKDQYSSQKPAPEDDFFQKYLFDGKSDLTEWIMKCGLPKTYAVELNNAIKLAGKTELVINENHKLATIKDRLRILEDNLLPENKDVEECVDAILTSEATDSIIEYLQYERIPTDIYLNEYLAVIRAKLTTENIRNHTEYNPEEKAKDSEKKEERKREKTEIYFTSNCQKEFFLVLQGITNILINYTFDSDALELKENRSKENLKKLLDFKPQYISYEKECLATLSKLCEDWIDEYKVQLKAFETNILPHIHFTPM